MPKTTPLTNPFPASHLAILFEGAWIFSPSADGGVLATCPLPEMMGDGMMHGYSFGVWNAQEQRLDAVAPFKEIQLENTAPYKVEVQGYTKGTDGTFDAVFKTAADKYPFVYLSPEVPAPSPKGKKSSYHLLRTQDATDRSVTIPLPTTLIADGAMVSAEVDGRGCEGLYNFNESVKRPHVAFIFVYEFPKGVKPHATVSFNGVTGTVASKPKNANPHLIFDVFPASMPMTGGGSMAIMMDQSGEKCHATATFELLRKTVGTGGVRGTQEAGVCDITLYHSRHNIDLVASTSGLDSVELGLMPGVVSGKGLKLPSCAGGGVGVGGGDPPDPPNPLAKKKK